MSLSPRKEPAVYLGLLGSILAVVAQQLVTGSITWAAVAPAITSILIRFFVTPTAPEGGPDASPLPRPRLH